MPVQSSETETERYPVKIAIPKEIYPGERRVAATPDSVRQLLALGFTVAVESGAGAGSSFDDAAYAAAGAEIVSDTRALWSGADIVLKVRAPQQHPAQSAHEADLLHEGACLISFIWPAQNPELMQRLAARRATVLAMDSVPRLSRAQKLDALSSMANIAGYRAVIEAAHHFGRFFTGQVTAAGKVPPAKVLVIGAGVAGLAAIGAAANMGAIVRGFDTRPEVKEQVESLDAEFLQVAIEEEGTGTGGYAKEMSKAFIEAEMALFAAQAKEVDIIITTALIPGRPAPKLITAEMVRAMKPGSVIVDLAAEQGGNCELTVPGEAVVRAGVTIVGYADMPSRLAAQASQLYANNVRNLLAELAKNKDGVIAVNMDDEVIRGATVIKDGAITWPPPPPKLSAAPVKPKPAAAPIIKPEPKRLPAWTSFLALAAGAGLLVAMGAVAPPAFVSHFTVFVLAIFIGWQVIWNVTPALHTPLMSVTNAISGIIVIGALLQLASPSGLVWFLAAFAVLIAAINVFGGFWVTQRMLQMFRK